MLPPPFAPACQVWSNQPPASTSQPPLTQRHPPLPSAHLQLLDSQAVGVRREKMYRLDDHIACAVRVVVVAVPTLHTCASTLRCWSAHRTAKAMSA